jgi:hypothetical protein
MYLESLDNRFCASAPNKVGSKPRRQSNFEIECRYISCNQKMHYFVYVEFQDTHPGQCLNVDMDVMEYDIDGLRTRVDRAV